MPSINLNIFRVFDRFSWYLTGHNTSNRLELFFMLVFLHFRKNKLEHDYPELISDISEDSILDYNEVVPPQVKKEYSLLINLSKTFKDIPNHVNRILRFYKQEYHDKLDSINEVFYISTKIPIDDLDVLYKLKENIFSLSFNEEKEVSYGLNYNQVVKKFQQKLNYESLITSNDIVDLCSQLTKHLKLKSIYDPACGTGSLLFDSSKYNKDVTLHGHDIDPKQIMYAKMTLFLDNNNTHEFEVKNTYVHDNHHSQKVDLILSEPPIAFNDVKLIDKREYMDFDQFIGNISSKLRQEGLMILILPRSILYREGYFEMFRNKIVEQFNSLDAVIIPRFNNAKRNNQKYVILIFRPRRNRVISLSRKNLEIEFIDREILFINDINEALTMQELASVYFDKREIPNASCLITREQVISNNCSLKTSLYLTETKEQAKTSEDIRNRIYELEKELKEIQNCIRNM